MAAANRKRPFGKVTLTFTAIIICLVLTTVTVGSISFDNVNKASLLQNQLNSLQSSNNQLQTNYNDLQAQYNQLNSRYQGLKTIPTITPSPITTPSPTIIPSNDLQVAQLQSQISNLQTELANATRIIAQLQGPTGILPTYQDLSYVSTNPYSGAYWLQLSLKNTGPISITQIFVSINSVQVDMPFTYLNGTVSANNPLLAYQTTMGRLNVTPPVNNIATYPLVIQAVAVNGTIYTYQTTITAHV